MFLHKTTEKQGREPEYERTYHLNRKSRRESEADLALIRVWVREQDMQALRSSGRRFIIEIAAELCCANGVAPGSNFI